MIPERLLGPPRSTAFQVAREVVERGAKAVVVVGSYARGEASSESDLDLLAVGPESYLPRLSFREGLIVSVSMQPFEIHRGSFEQPELICTAVPGWRQALVLHDPEGLAADLIREAQEWSWEPYERRCDRWVAKKTTEYAEEVFKLVAALKHNRRSTAAAQRNLLALHLAPMLAVHHRILYGSENTLWELVSSTMGNEWSRNQYAALGVNGETLEMSCMAALNLYEITADNVYDLLDDGQKTVVDYAKRCRRRL